MTAAYIELALLIISAIISDFQTYKIDNRLIAVFLVVGILTGMTQGGLNGLVSSLLGAFLPFLLLFWLYKLRMLGAGDVKLFCAVGAVAGIGFISWCVAWSFIGGGLAALIIMVSRRNLSKRFRYLWSYLKACFLSQSFLEYSEISDQTGGGKFHFSLAVAFGSMVQVLLTLL